MKRHLIAGMLGVSVAFLFNPAAIFAQTTSGTGGSTTTSGTTGGAGVGGGGGSMAGGTNSTTIGTTTPLTSSQTVYAATSGTASTTTIPSNGNFLANTMVLPQSLGLPNNYINQFGSQNTISSAGGPKGSYTYLFTAPPSAASGAASTAPTTANGFTSYGIQRAPVYSTVLSPSMPIPKVATSRLQTDLRAMISRSSQLKDKAGIQVSVQGNVVTLSGTVADEDERRIVEGMCRMTYGVTDVRNSLTVPAANAISGQPPMSQSPDLTQRLP